MNRPSLQQSLLAFSAGCLLLWLALVVAGILAASAAPSPLQPLLQGQGWIGFLLHSTLLVHIPVALFSGLFALVAFRLLRARGLLVVLALSAPWLIYCFLAAFSWYRGTQFSPLQILGLELAWHKWIVRLSVPLGVWAASKLPTGALRDGTAR